MRKMTTLALFLLLAGAEQAQNITGSRAGRVVDPQGSAVPSAVVTVSESSKNLTITGRPVPGDRSSSSIGIGQQTSDAGEGHPSFTGGGSFDAVVKRVS